MLYLVVLIHCFAVAAVAQSQIDTEQLVESSLSKDDIASFGFATAQLAPPTAKCKTFPTDASWPSDALWNRLNTLTGGVLIKTIPLAAPCYPGPYENAAKCSFVTSQWSNSSLQ